MEFITGLVTGWLSAPFVIPVGIWFFLMFPVLYWDIDIYEEDHPSFRLWQFLLGSALLVAALHFLHLFDARSLLAGSFWTVVLHLWYWVVGYFVVGILYAMVLRWPFYVIEYNNRTVRPELAKLGPNPPEEKVQALFNRYNLTGYGSRYELIVRWIYSWPWSAVSWICVDFLRQVGEFIRNLIGGRFADIARAFEPKEFKDLRARNRAKT